MNADQNPVELDVLCQLYLLDELELSQREDFEWRMTTEPVLLDMLAKQASLLASVGEAIETEVQGVELRYALPVSAFRIVSVVASVAAVLLLVFWLGQRNRSVQVTAKQNLEPVSFDVATYWASNRSTFALSEFAGDDSDVDTEFEVVASTELPSWLALGVAEIATQEKLVEGDSVDG